MRKRRFEFSSQEQAQMLIDKLILDGDIPEGKYLTSIGVRREKEDLVFWIEVTPHPMNERGRE